MAPLKGDSTGFIQPYKIGDKVTFTNDYGAVFTGHKVIGFYEGTYERYKGRVYLDIDCSWFPIDTANLTREV